MNRTWYAPSPAGPSLPVTASARRVPLGFTLVELLVVIAIIGVMVGLLLPAVQSAREAARRMQCQNSFKQIGIALHNYHGTHNVFPAGWLGHDESGRHFVDGASGWGWTAMILPQLEQTALYERLDFNQTVLSESNSQNRSTPIAILRCGSDTGASLWEIHDRDSDSPLATLATSNYIGCYGTFELDECEETPLGEHCTSDGMFFHNSRLRFADMIDGTSTTIMIGERTSRLGMSTWVGNVPNGEDSFARILGVGDHPPNHPGAHMEDFSSLHPGGTQFLYGDGRVQFMSENIDHAIYQAQCTRAGREVADSF